MFIQTMAQLMNSTGGGAGTWLGSDYALTLCAATFPAWSLFTLLRAWVCARPATATVSTTER